MATLRPVTRSSVAKQAAQTPGAPNRFATPPAAASAVEVRSKPVQLVGKMSGSLSNSLTPHEPLLHPTDLARFKRKKGRR